VELSSLPLYNREDFKCKLNSMRDYKELARCALFPKTFLCRKFSSCLELHIGLTVVCERRC
jgi:hypothetical protein